MIDTRPDPLVLVECDLTDFQFMPLDVARLRDSELASNETPEACWAAVLIWCASWHQVPPGSIPNDDRWIAQAANYARRGRIDREWKDVRSGALRGWIECNDGRLYHPVVAEKARDAWRAKMAQRYKTECGRIKKHCQRHSIPFNPPDFEQWMSIGCPQGLPLTVPGTNTGSPGDTTPAFQGTNTGCPGNVPGETPSKGQGEGQGQGQGYIKEKTPLSAKADVAASPPEDKPTGKSDDIAEIFEYWQERMQSPRSKLDDKRRKVIKVALKSGYTPRQLCQAIRGCSLTPHNMGKNEQGQKYNGIDLIFRNADQIDRFIANDVAPPVAAPAPGVKPWQATWTGIVTKGQEFGIVQGDNEPPPDFKARVFAAANMSDGEKATLRADYGVSV